MRYNNLKVNFTMSRRISMLLLKNYHNKLSSFNVHFGFNNLLSASLTNVSVIQRLSSSALSGNIQVSKQLKPLINLPIDTILANVDADTTRKESVILLKALRFHTLFNGADTSSFTNDSRFKVLCEVFEKNCQEVNSTLLISGLRSLLEIGVSPTSSYVIAAEERLLKCIPLFSCFNLIGCLYYHHRFAETDLQKKVISMLVDKVQNKLSEISTTSEILMLIHIYYLFKNGNEKMLEQKIAEFVPSLSVHEMCRLICVMGEKSNRNVTILNKVAFYMQQSSEKPDLKETIDVFYVFKKLNFYDPNLFSYLLNHFEHEIPAIKQASLVSGFLTICGHLKWRHTGILDACGEWIEKNLDICRTREFVSYVLAAAAVNHCTSQTESVLKQILPQLTLESVKSSEVMLDITWCLGVLNNVPKELLLSVLSSKFYKPLLDISDPQTSTNIRLKLLNLKGILKMKYPECVFGCELYLDPIKLPESLNIENSREHVMKVLSNFVPTEKYLCTNQVSDTGIFIDAEFIMNKNSKPLSLQEYGVMSKPASVTKSLPKECKRIALLVMFHKDYTHCITSLTGVNALGTRVLVDAGYTVVIIPYSEFSRKKTEVQKAKYLLQKITDSMQINP